MNEQRIPQWKIGITVILILLVGCSTPANTPTSFPPPTLPSASISVYPTQTKTQPHPVVIDTDMAVDDWMAILYLLQRQNVEVKAITVTGAGEAHCAPGVRNAIGLTALAGSDQIPVACGRDMPLQGTHVFPDSWRVAVDNLLGLSLPENQNTPSSLTAVELLTSVIQASPQKVTLLTLGPLTNVAEALQSNPALKDNIEMIYIMGGAVNVPGNIKETDVKIKNTVAEWNVYVDPSAANIVLQSSAPITLVPLDATNQAPLTSQFYKQLKDNHATQEATFVFNVLDQMKDFIESGSYYFWDPLAAAILTDNSLASYQTNNLCVIETEGSESGWMISGDKCPQVRETVSVDVSRFEQFFLDTLTDNSPDAYLISPSIYGYKGLVGKSENWRT
jgi:inosine-uridine nucleoside N-ribohydrolase